MKTAGVTAGALAVLLAACEGPTRPIVAEVNGGAITEAATVAELQSLLWRRGETWTELPLEAQKAARATALENLIDARLIAEFAGLQARASNPIGRESEDEFQQFLKQFPPPDEWKERMQLQGLDETALRRMIAAETCSLDAIESWLAQQPGKVTEADARAWFEAHKTDFTISERVRASHIFLTRHDKEKPDREPEIRELHRKINSGESTFEDLATRNSDDDAAKLRSGDLGWFTRQRVPPEFADKVFALPVGEVSAPFESHLGWHILLVKARQPQREATFEEAKGEIAAMLETRWREASVKRLLDELRSKARIQKFEERIAMISPE